MSAGDKVDPNTVPPWRGGMHSRETGELVEDAKPTAADIEVDLDVELLGRTAFEAYSDSVGGHTYDGKPIPTWPSLSDAVRLGWTRAASAVAACVVGALSGE